MELTYLLSFLFRVLRNWRKRKHEEKNGRSYWKGKKRKGKKRKGKKIKGKWLVLR